MKEKLKNIGLDFLLFLPRTFGLVKLWNWLFNKKKIFNKYEILINWILLILGIALVIVVGHYTSLTFKYELKTTPTPSQKTLIDKWGTAIFFLTIITFSVIPFKVYLKKKRFKVYLKKKRRQNHENKN